MQAVTQGSNRQNMEAKTLGDRLDYFANKFPEKTALVAPFYAMEACYQTISFKDLRKRSDAYAAGLKKQGIVPGQIVLLMVPPGVEFASLWFALSKLGAIVMLIDPGMGRKNLLKCIEQIGPEALISVPLVHYLKRIFKNPFKKVKVSITTKSAALISAASLSDLRKEDSSFKNKEAKLSDLATIAFTTGSTGIPKGVIYTERTVSAQLSMIQKAFLLTENDISFPAFLPFSIFSLALGHTTIMPSYDPRKPAFVDEKKIVDLLKKHNPTYSFGSPAFWGRVSSWALERQLKLAGLKQVIMFGAPVTERTLQSLKDTFLEKEADCYTPYGATEALPLSNIAGREILGETMPKTKVGHGVCVGRPLEEIELKIIKISDELISTYEEIVELEPGEVGEIVVRGDVVSEGYFNRLDQTQAAKIKDGQNTWHRMGDLGYLDKEGRLWFCGRKSHRVCTARTTLCTIPVEAVFNQHKDVFKTALVGLGEKGKQRPVLCVELKKEMDAEDLERIEKELYLISTNFPHTREVRDFLFKRKLPVDFRHNAKIIREELAVWAAKRLAKYQP